MGAVAEWMIVWCLLLASFGAVVVYVSGRSPSIVAVAQRTAGGLGWAAFAGVVMYHGVGLRGWHEWVLIFGGITALIAALWHCEIARRSHHWPTGKLNADGSHARLLTESASYLLGEMPDGCAPGEWLTLPGPTLQPTPSGPYRSSRPVGRVPYALRISGRELSNALWWRGITHAAFGIVTLIWATR